MKILVVYYSRTETTKKVAEEIAEKLGADIEEIKSPEIKDRGFFQYLKAGKQAVKKDMPAIETSGKEVGDYELTVLGTPVWAGTMASPLRSYLNKNKDKFQRVAFFCTCADKETRAFKEMRKLINKTPEARFVLRAGKVKRDDYKDQIEKFINNLESLQ